MPPLPPHITLQQAKNFPLALMKGNPNESSVIKGAARQVLETILPGKERAMGDFRDIQNGVNDPVDGVDVKRRFNDNKTPHERAQRHADVRAKPSALPGEPFLPERLRRKPTDPINPRTGRHPTD